MLGRPRLIWHPLKLYFTSRPLRLVEDLKPAQGMRPKSNRATGIAALGARARLVASPLVHAHSCARLRSDPQWMPWSGHVKRNTIILEDARTAQLQISLQIARGHALALRRTLLPSAPLEYIHARRHAHRARWYLRKSARGTSITRELPAKHGCTAPAPIGSALRARNPPRVRDKRAAPPRAGAAVVARSPGV